jgi:hypothetical protein
MRCGLNVNETTTHKSMRCRFTIYSLFSDIKKSKFFNIKNSIFWYQKLWSIFFISKNRIFDIKKSFSDIKKKDDVSNSHLNTYQGRWRCYRWTKKWTSIIPCGKLKKIAGLNHTRCCVTFACNCGIRWQLQERRERYMNVIRSNIEISVNTMVYKFVITFGEFISWQIGI